MLNSIIEQAEQELEEFIKQIDPNLIIKVVYSLPDATIQIFSQGNTLKRITPLLFKIFPGEIKLTCRGNYREIRIDMGSQDIFWRNWFDKE